MNYFDCNNAQPLTILKTSSTIGEPSDNFTGCSLPKDTCDEEQIAFKAFTEAGGPGEVLKKEIEERSQILHNKYKEAKQTAQELQARRETITTLRQQLHESKESSSLKSYRCWSSKNSMQELNQDKGQNQINIGRKTLHPQICSTDGIEFTLKREQEAYKYALTKLHELKCETDHLNNSLKQAEIQLKYNFKCYWDRIQSFTLRSALEKNNTSPLTKEFLESTSSISTNTANVYACSQNSHQQIINPANLNKSQNQGFNGNNLLEGLQYDFGHSSLSNSPTLNPPCIIPTPNSSFCASKPHPSSYVQTHDPSCYVQTSNQTCYIKPPNPAHYLLAPNQSCFMSKPNPTCYVQTSNPLCHVPTPNRSWNVFTTYESNMSTLNPICYDKSSTQRFNKHDSQDFDAKSTSYNENGISNKHVYSTAYIPEVRQKFNFMADHSPEKKSNDELQRTSFNSSILPSTHYPVNATPIQASNGNMDSNVQHTYKINSDFHKHPENDILYSSLQVPEGNNCFSSNQIPAVKNNMKDVNYIEDNLPLTGDKEVDDEILAFYKARNRILERKRK